MASKAHQKDDNIVWETISVVLQALVLALVLRTFLFQPFNIPSGSMKPTLLIGDYLFVSKFSYGFSKHSFPFSPNLFDGRVLQFSEPERGDVVVFKFPVDNSTDYIKRVIGLPGDKVEMRNSVVYINDVALPRAQNGAYTDEGNRATVPVWVEKQDNGKSYSTIDTEPGGFRDNYPAVTVPPDNYFVMGDNRDNSSDSRYDVQFMPAENLVGKAQIIFLSLRNGTPAWQIWKWPTQMRWDRIFTWL
ncbi:MAG: signal peptidase I [Pseudomonadota bacterium]